MSILVRGCVNTRLIMWLFQGGSEGDIMFLSPGDRTELRVCGWDIRGSVAVVLVFSINKLLGINVIEP